jgi:protein TonB
MTTLAVQRTRAGGGGRFILLALGLSLIVHLVVYRSMAPATPPPRLEDTAVQVQWIEPQPQPKAPAAKPTPLPVSRPVVKVIRKGPTQVKSTPAPIAREQPRAPPARTAELPQAAPAKQPVQPAAEPARPPPPELTGINFASTVAESGFVVPVGTTLSGAPPRLGAAPPALAGQGRYGRRGKTVAFDQISEPPVLLDEVRAAYPEAARKAGITGEVVLLLTIDASGTVAEARRISGPGHGLDEAALAAIWRFRFRPAQQDGEPVATVIRDIYSFEID